MTLEEAMKTLNKSKAALTTNFGSLKKILAKEGIEISKKKRSYSDYEINYISDYWKQPLIKNYPRLYLGKSLNLFGKRFNRLTCLYRTLNPNKPDDTRNAYWLCKCDCGNYSVHDTWSLISKDSQSCGCLQREKASQINMQNLVGRTFGRLTVLKLDPVEYATAAGNHYRKWICQCSCEAKSIVSKKTSELLNGNVKSCGCLRSSGEEKIKILLKENNILFETEKSFEHCRFIDTNALAFFDFYLPNYNILIEYDGEQHFKVHGWNTEERLKIVQERDVYKTKWALENNYTLIRIPYTHYKDLCLEDLLENSEYKIQAE